MPRIAHSQVLPVRSHRKTLEAAEQSIAPASPRKMKSTGPAKQALEPSSAIIEVPDRPVDTAKLDMLRFMEDVLTVMVHPTSNKTDPPLVEVINDGVRQFFIRGREQKVKRKFIEILGRAKTTSYVQEKYTDSEGNEAYRYIPIVTLTTPFAVLHDPAGERGVAWLKALLEAA